jgi:polyphosphate kinase 2 (PPK2 family)
VFQLVRIWLQVSDAEQKRRFEARIEDSLRQWKLEGDGSPVVQSGVQTTPVRGT